jgi:TonB-linked SusC/RagA family outer membrane protein
MELEKVLNEIEKQTDFLFVYNNHVNVNRKVSVNLNRASLEKTLDNLFKGTDVKYSIDGTYILLSTKDVITKSPSSFTTIVQQKRTVTGKVVDEKGEPIIGANVVEKGTTNGIITDVDGNFSIAVNNSNAILLVSYIGYTKQEVSINGRNSLRVLLKEDSETLDEVVVVAYGTAKRSAITGAMSVINSESIEKNKTTNITAGLQGMVAGVQVVNTSGQPGSDQTVMIRGLGSMTASSNPLYVVDGVPYDLSLNSIASSDIESISVLKDAAAASLYGAHAANGVVLITTKKGRSDKTKIDFYATLSTANLAVPFPEKVSTSKQWENSWQGLYNDATDFLNMSDADARKYASENVSAQYYDPMPFTLSDGTQRLYHSGWNTDYPVGLDGKIKPDATRLYDFDLYKEVFKYRLKQEYGVNFSGAMNDKNKYYVSMSYLNDKGAYIGDGYERYTGRATLDSKLAKWLDMNNSIMYTRSNNTNSGFDVRPMRTFANESTIYIYDYNTGTYKDRAMNPGQWALDNSRETGRIAYTPDMSWMYSEKANILQNLNTTTSLTAKIIDGLTFKTTYSYQLWNQFSLNNNPPDDGAYVDEPEWGGISRSTTNAETNYFNNVLTYDKYFGVEKVHHINTFIGQEAYIYRSRGFNADRSGLEVPFFRELDQATGYPGVSSWRDSYNLYSYFFKGQYDFKEKYFLTGSYRMDGSSRFAPSKRWGGFFSFGGAWVISREKFMKSLPWLNSLKLRASYGELGNDNVGGYYGYQGYYGVGGNYNGKLGMSPTQLSNSDLKWESNANMNLGLDFTAWNRFSGTFEIYKRKSKDLLMDMQLPTSSGWESTLRNVGNLENVGYEIELNYLILKNKDLSWSVNGNASHFKNKITSLPYGEKESQTDINGDSGVAYYKWIVGGSRYDIYCSDWAGVNPDNGRNTWWKYSFDENGKITGKEKTENYSEVNNTAQRRNVGSALPKLYGSFGTNLQWKKFDFSAMIYYSLGGKVYDYNYAESSVLRECWATYKDLDKSWKKAGDITDYAKVYMNYAGQAYSRNNIGSSQWVSTNNYMRLKNLVIGYTFANPLMKKVGISGLRLYFRGENLFTTGKLAKRGTDPEAGGLWGQNKSGTTYFSTRNYNLGINLTFN